MNKRNDIKIPIVHGDCGGLTKEECIERLGIDSTYVRDQTAEIMEHINPISYRIVKQPVYIVFNCPYCKEMYVEVPLNKVNFKTGYWFEGASCVCPYCTNEIELGDYEYD